MAYKRNILEMPRDEAADYTKELRELKGLLEREGGYQVYGTIHHSEGPLRPESMNYLLNQQNAAVQLQMWFEVEGNAQFVRRLKAVVSSDDEVNLEYMVDRLLQAMPGIKVAHTISGAQTPFPQSLNEYERFFEKYVPEDGK